MKIKKIGDGRGARYVVRWKVWGSVDGKRVVKSWPQRTFDRRRDAETFIENLGAERRKDRNASKRLYADYAATWLNSIIAKGRKRRTIDDYRSKLGYSLEYFDGMPVADITPLDAANFMIHLQSEECPDLKVPRSVIGAWHPFRSTMKLAARQTGIDNPANAVDLPGQGTDDDRQAKYHFLREAEVDRLSDALAAPYDLLVRFDAYTGLRRAEISGLDVRHLRLVKSGAYWSGRVRVEQTRELVNGEWLVDKPKSNRARTVPLPSWLAEDMHVYLTEVHPNGDNPNAPLFPNRKRGGHTHGANRKGAAGPGSLLWSEPVEMASFYRNVFKPAVLAVGLPADLRFHDLRHTYASLQAARGVRSEVVAKLMGHADATVTLKIYTHLWEEHLDEAVAGWERPARSERREGAAVIPMSR